MRRISIFYYKIHNYDRSKTIEENLESAMFAGGLMNIINKIEPTLFQ